jgi:hypothetical protein
MHAIKKTSARNGSADSDTEVEEAEREMLERINATKFDRSGLRVHTAPLARDEYDFRAVQPWEAKMVAEYEYDREIKRHYDAERILCEAMLGSTRSKKEMVKWRYPNPNPLAHHHLLGVLFPMPWKEHRRIMGPGTPPEVNGLEAFEEIDEERFNRGLEASTPKWSYHRIFIDWSKGSKAVQREMLHWVSSMAKGRSRAKYPVDYNVRLQQLAAWRAARAGMGAQDYLKLRMHSFKMSRVEDFRYAGLNAYEDPSTFKKACSVVDTILKRNLKEWEKVVKG